MSTAACARVAEKRLQLLVYIYSTCSSSVQSAICTYLACVCLSVCLSDACMDICLSVCVCVAASRTAETARQDTNCNFTVIATICNSRFWHSCSSCLQPCRLLSAAKFSSYLMCRNQFSFNPSNLHSSPRTRCMLSAFCIHAHSTRGFEPGTCG